jgi:hypothetical protein
VAGHQFIVRLADGSERHFVSADPRAVIQVAVGASGGSAPAEVWEDGQLIAVVAGWRAAPPLSPWAAAMPWRLYADGKLQDRIAFPGGWFLG